MVNSRAKGQRGEYLVRDLLRAHTDLQFERVPASGALPYLKGDIYVPNEKNKFCIEVKNYSESSFTDKIFTQPKTNNLLKWWHKVCNQAENCKQKPLLFFRYDRSKIFVATDMEPVNLEKHVYINWLGCYVCLAEDWLENETIQFLGN